MPHMGETLCCMKWSSGNRNSAKTKPQDLQDSQYDIYDDLDLHTKFLKYFEGYMKPKNSQKIGLKETLSTSPKMTTAIKENINQLRPITLLETIWNLYANIYFLHVTKTIVELKTLIGANSLVLLGTFTYDYLLLLFVFLNKVKENNS
jgi:hypothetical protein